MRKIANCLFAGCFTTRPAVQSCLKTLPALPTTLWYYDKVEFIESRRFTAKLHRLAGDTADEVLRSIQSELAQNPGRGAMVPGLGGIRKARATNPGRGKGKRGGYRYLYLYLEKRQHIHFLILLDKNEQEDASEEQRRQMRTWVAEIKKDSGGRTCQRKSK